MSHNAHLRRDEAHHRQAERRAERREDRLHARAVNQALHGNVIKAVKLEARSNAAGNRADAHHARADHAHVARVTNPPPPVHVHHHPHPHHHHPPPPPSHVTVVHHHPPPASHPPPPGYNPGYPYPH